MIIDELIDDIKTIWKKGSVIKYVFDRK
jgi:hypothetical protein